MRLRQVVLAAHDLGATERALRAALPLGDAYADPGVALFGLRNAVLPLGDTFVEVVSPVRDDAPAARHIARRGGDCGYMVMLEVGDLLGARERAERLGVRVVWEAALDDIAAVHLHPADTGGALLSLDEPRPAGSWRWAGPAWRPSGAPGLRGATLAVPDPESVAARWAALLDRPAHDGRIELDDGELRFVRGEAGLCEVRVADGAGATVVSGVRFVPVG